MILTAAVVGIVDGGDLLVVVLIAVVVAMGDGGRSVSGTGGGSNVGVPHISSGDIRRECQQCNQEDVAKRVRLAGCGQSHVAHTTKLSHSPTSVALAN